MNDISKYLIYLIVLTGLAWVYAGFKMKGMPFVRDIHESLYDEPEQEETSIENFTFEYAEKEYVAQPLYEYKINGLVVSNSDITSMLDGYRMGRSINLKDLCLTWGDNLKNSAFRKMKFWNKSSTCFYEFGEYKKYLKTFNGNNLSNNHLVTDREYLIKKINRVKPGDQVRISGYLVNYFPKGASEKLAQTSTSRTDSGDVATEIVYVDMFHIIEPGKETWTMMYSVFKKLFYFLILIEIIYLCVAFQIQKEFKKE